MDAGLATVIAGAIGALGAIGSAIIGTIYGKRIGFKEGYLKRDMFYEKAINSAAKEYIRHLDKLISKALDEGPENSLINAKAIVSVRNDLRKTLISLADLLNTEISQLAILIGEPDELDKCKNKKDKDVLKKYNSYDIIQVLHKKWPSKKSQVEHQINKLIIELGLREKHI